MWKLHSYRDDVSFYHYDEYARKIANADIKTFDDIVCYLRDGVNEDTPDRDLYLARGFFVFLSLAYEDKTRFTFENYDDIIDSTVTCFDRFFRAAAIECVGIKGTIKTDTYEVGDDKLENTHYWLAFKVDEQWHLLDPGGCLVGIENHETGGKILLENDGNKAIQEIAKSDGHHITRYDDFMFCINPEVLLYSQFPEDPKWQFLKETNSPVTLKEWLNMPFCQRSFFKYNLRLLSEHTCRIRTNCGRCNVQIMADETTAQHLKFQYKLFLSKADMTPDLTPGDWPLLVLAGRESNIFSFEVRCPVPGKYTLGLFVGLNSEIFVNKCCEFSIVCDNPDPNCRRLPINPAHGFGYIKQAGVSGLNKPSVVGPKIFAKRHVDQSIHDDEKQVNLSTATDEQMPKLTFRIDEDALEEEEYASFLYSKGRQGESYPSRLNESTRMLDVTPPVLSDETEYAVSISKRPKKSKVETVYTPLMYYIVTFEDSSKYDNVRQTALRIMHEQRQQRTLAKKQKKKTQLTDQLNTIQKQLQDLQAMIDAQHDSDTDANADTDASQVDMDNERKHESSLPGIDCAPSIPEPGPRSADTKTDESTNQASFGNVPGKCAEDVVDPAVVDTAIQVNIEKITDHCSVTTQTGEQVIEHCNVTTQTEEKTTEHCTLGTQTGDKQTKHCNVAIQTAEESDPISAGAIGGRHASMKGSKHTRKAPTKKASDSSTKSSGVCVLV